MVGTVGYKPCKDLSEDSMMKNFKQAKDIDSVILSTYALAAVAKQLAPNNRLVPEWYDI